MLVVKITASLIYLMVHGIGTFAFGSACWDERLSGFGGNSSCVGQAPQPFLIFGHGKTIHRIDLDGKNQRRLLTGVGSSILIDFHFREERVYWSDRHAGAIYTASVGRAHREKLYSADKSISGLAVDWISNHVYWSSEDRGKIKRMDLNGEKERTVLKHLTQPNSIAIDPVNRFLFWLSGGMKPRIQRSGDAGQMKTTLLMMSHLLTSLTIDRQDRRLFWVQNGPQGDSAIASCDYNGNVLHIMDQPVGSHAVSISLFLEHLYYTDEDSRTIKQINKYTGGDNLDVNMKQMTKSPTVIRVVHPLNQPTSEANKPFPGCDEKSGNCMNVCSTRADKGACQCSRGFALSKRGTFCRDINECALWNHGCSLGCENVPGSYFCTCPKGYALLPDRKTCREIVACEGNTTRCGQGCLATDEGVICVCPEGSLLQEDGQGCTGCSSPDRGGCSQLCTSVTPAHWQCSCLPGYLLHKDGYRCVATGPPPYLLVANLVDVRRIDPDNNWDGTLVQEPRGAIIALDYDPVQNYVYFASTTQRTIARIDLMTGSKDTVISDGLDVPEGLAIDWINRRMCWTDKGQATVECSTLAGLDRGTIVNKGLQKPRGIAVHPQQKKLFWTDMGDQPVVESASLEGKNRLVIASTNLVAPSGLAIDFTDDRLFWCDQSRRLVETAAMDGSDRRVLTENQVGRPFNLAVFEDKVWVSDGEHQLVRSIHKRTGEKLQQSYRGMVQPASIVVVHPLAKPGADVCLHLNGGCAQLCESRLGFAHCSCLSHFIPSNDGKDCLPVHPLNGSAETTDSTLSMPGNNKTLNNDNLAEGAMSQERPLLTDKMVSDQNECYSIHCDVNSQCLQHAGSPVCLCLEGFTGDGQVCADIDECDLGSFTCDRHAACQNTEGGYLCKCQAGYRENGHTCQELESTLPKVTTSNPADVSTQHHNSNSILSCPSTHESYCLYQGICFYFPEMDSYACNCVSGYMGERCQFSDLEWWEQQQAETEKRKSVVIATCTVVLITLLSIISCVTYCYGTRRCLHKQPSEDNVSETSETDESMSETTSSLPRLCVVVENGTKGDTVPPTGCPRRTTCPSCSSDAGDIPPSEEEGALPKHNRGYECSTMSALAMEATKPAEHQSECVSVAHTRTQLNPAPTPHAPSAESSPS